MSNNIEELGLLVQKIRKSIEVENFDDIQDFPSKSKLRNLNLNIQIFLRQACNLIDKKSILGFDSEEVPAQDFENLASIYLDDIKQYLTANYKYFKKHNIEALWTQSVLNDRSLFNIAREALLSEAYKDIDLLGNKEFYEIYSCPFILRLAIENKLIKIIGFKSCDIKRNNSVRKDTTEIPVSMVLSELDGMRCLDLPCSISNILNIYSWANSFCHTAKKEPIWLISLAIEKISPLFDYSINKGKNRPIYEILGLSDSENLSISQDEDSLGCFTVDNENLNLDNYRDVTYFLRKEWTVDAVEKRLNSSRNINLKPYKFKLSIYEMDEVCGFYNKRIGKYI